MPLTAPYGLKSFFLRRQSLALPEGPGPWIIEALLGPTLSANLLRWAYYPMVGLDGLGNDRDNQGLRSQSIVKMPSLKTTSTSSNLRPS